MWRFLVRFYLLNLFQTLVVGQSHEKEENPYSAHQIFVQCLLVAPGCSRHCGYHIKQTNSLTSHLTVCLSQVPLATHWSQFCLSPVAQNNLIAFTHVVDILSFYPITCLGFNAKFLILPEYHLRTRQGGPHMQVVSRGSSRASCSTVNSSCSEQIREVQDCNAQLHGWWFLIRI